MWHEENFCLRNAADRRYRFRSMATGFHRTWPLHGVAVCRLPLNLRMVEELVAAGSIELTYATVRCWATKFRLCIARRIGLTSPSRQRLND